MSPPTFDVGGKNREPGDAVELKWKQRKARKWDFVKIEVESVLRRRGLGHLVKRCYECPLKWEMARTIALAPWRTQNGDLFEGKQGRSVLWEGEAQRDFHNTFMITHLSPWAVGTWGRMLAVDRLGFSLTC